MVGRSERLHNEVGASRPHESPLGTSADRASPQLREGAEHVSSVVIRARGHQWSSVVIEGAEHVSSVVIRDYLRQ